MSKNTTFVANTTAVPSDYLNDLEEGHTGSIWGVRLSVSGGTTINLTGDALTETQYSVRIGAKPRYGTVTVPVVASGGAGARDIYITSAAVDTPKAAAMELTVPPATPAAAFSRKIGSATWSGAAVTDLRLLTGVQANADQVNSFIFTPALNTGIPLTVKGLASQSADILRVEDSAGTGILRVTNTSVIFGAVSATGVVAHPLGTQALPSITFTGDTSTGIYSPAAGRVAISTTNLNNFEVNAASGVLIGTSTAATPLFFGADVSMFRGAANRLDLSSGDSLNIVSGSLMFGGTAMASSNLSDSAGLARLAGGTFTGATVHPAGTAAAPTVNFTGAATSGMYSPAGNQLGLAANGLGVLTASATGLVQLPTCLSSTVYLQLGTGVKMYAGAGTGVSQISTDALTVLGQDLEVRKSDGVSRLILSRPDGTRIALSFDNANGIVITQLP